MQSRRIARELALLSLSQLSANSEKLSDRQISDLLVAAIRTLSGEVKDALEAAAAEVQRSDDRLLSSEIRAVDVQSARAMVREAIEITQGAINRVGATVELPEFILLANQKDVRDYAVEIIDTVNSEKVEIDRQLTQAMIDWQLNRLARIDRDILRIAVGEMKYLAIPEAVAINEAVELAKRYSGEDGHRFINGVLRRVSEQVKMPMVSE